MIGIAHIYQFYLRKVKPVLTGQLTSLLHSRGNVRIGSGLRADGLPRMLVDRTASVKIGKNVELRSGVEIRAHNFSSITIGDGVRIDRGVRILAANNAELTIESGARIGLGTVLNGGDSIYIGAKALVSGYVYLQTSMHSFQNPNVAIRDQGYAHAPLRLEEEAWLGTHVVIMPGVVVGVGAIVGSNAVVTKSVADGMIVAGVPAKVIGNRK